jgi:multisubunit Na+/H+ antiporter MnhB subunit
MKIPGWWKRRSGYAKTVAMLVVLLILQFGLCGVLNSNNEFGGGAIQGIVFIVTFALLIVVLVAWLINTLFL